MDTFRTTWNSHPHFGQIKLEEGSLSGENKLYVHKIMCLSMAQSLTVLSLKDTDKLVATMSENVAKMTSVEIVDKLNRNGLLEKLSSFTVKVDPQVFDDFSRSAVSFFLTYSDFIKPLALSFKSILVRTATLPTEVDKMAGTIKITGSEGLKYISCVPWKSRVSARSEMENRLIQIAASAIQSKKGDLCDQDSTDIVIGVRTCLDSIERMIQAGMPS